MKNVQLQPKLRLLVISSVLPFPRNTGQQQRVYYKLKALRNNFHITFFTVAKREETVEIRNKLLEFCDDAIVLPSLYSQHYARKVFHRVVGIFYSLLSGLKFSNYLMSMVEFSPHRLAMALQGLEFDATLFEYWHTHKVARTFRMKKTRTILDMHDILWRSHARQLDTSFHIPQCLKDWRVYLYQTKEEAAWRDFDILIAINQDEHEYTRQRVNGSVQVIYTPMGTDISIWPYIWKPVVSPRRIAFYGGLANPQNQRDALFCYREVMPEIWKKFPNVEFWIVGSNPPDFIRQLERDSRVHVTGFLPTPQEILKTISFILCPWSGTFGFRSRIVEVMSLGLPVLASSDAVYGMGFEEGNGIMICDSAAKMAEQGMIFLNNSDELVRQSIKARKQVEDKFSYESTYGNLADELSRLVTQSASL